MRAAPPVSVRGNGGWAWRAVQALLPALATAALTFWCCSLIDASATATATATLGFAALAAGAGLAVGLLTWHLIGRRAWQLSWGGQHWTLEAVSGGHAAAQGQLEVTVDLGWFMLLRLLPAAGRRRWIAMTARDAGVQWHGLRAAAYAHVSPQETDPAKARGTAAELRPNGAAR